ncbi:hypothetical protein KC669_04390 [Candidatus Dojkabacteria bacterium]|uniref:Type II secretion system protein n=1 Tax=Candidatus Dojkabacteria bacterium TaxID=2099670 RepID=A0A955LAS3_9BACT|nr:hypothetical protein [Candidatus Dojkabacteria bacterium]
MRLDLALFLVTVLFAVTLYISYRTKTKPGLTPVEVVLTSSLIISLISATSINISLNLNFAESRNAQRSNDVYQIANAVTLYYLDNYSGGENIKEIPECPVIEEIGIIDDTVKLYDKLSREYLVNFPIDPSEGNLAKTGYFICQDGERFKVAAPYAENGRIIQITM